MRGRNNKLCSIIFKSNILYFFEKNINTGAEMYIDEWVPNAIPNDNPALNPRQASPKDQQSNTDYERCK